MEQNIHSDQEYSHISCNVDQITHYGCFQFRFYNILYIILQLYTTPLHGTCVNITPTVRFPEREDSNHLRRRPRTAPSKKKRRIGQHAVSVQWFSNFSHFVGGDLFRNMFSDSCLT